MRWSRAWHATIPRTRRDAGCPRAILASHILASERCRTSSSVFRIASRGIRPGIQGTDRLLAGDAISPRDFRRFDGQWRPSATISTRTLVVPTARGDRRRTTRSSPSSSRGVSDGTLRVLGILVAVNQLASDGRPIRLVGIEEPETALHPAAAGALMDALREAATHTQVLVTTHGADLLDRYDPGVRSSCWSSTMIGGETRLSGIDAASRRIIQKASRHRRRPAPHGPARAGQRPISNGRRPVPSASRRQRRILIDGASPQSRRSSRAMAKSNASAPCCERLWYRRVRMATTSRCTRPIHQAQEHAPHRGRHQERPSG